MRRYRTRKLIWNPLDPEAMRTTWFPLIGALLACHVVGPTRHTTPTSDPEPVPTVLDTPVDFSGSQSAIIEPTQLSEIRIGMFAPTGADHPVGGPMYRAAQLAIEQANEGGGLGGVPFRLVTRWDDDPWRGGSKQMIKLVYEDSVWAVVGSVNGDATHIAEQVITKAWLPLLSPVSADPTLTYIRIPWMFRLPPDDKAQAEIIVRDGLWALSLKRVGLITSTDHDGRVFAEDMLDQMSAGAVPPLFHLSLSPTDFDADEIARRVESFSPTGVVIRLPRAAMFELLQRLQHHRIEIPVLVPWLPGVRLADLQRYYGAIHYVVPFQQVDDPSHMRFAQEYEKRYHTGPPPSAAYTYDAVTVIVRALREAGLSRSAMRDAIAGSVHRGVTGRISWDNAGGNKGRPVLVRGR